LKLLQLYSWIENKINTTVTRKTIKHKSEDQETTQLRT